MKQPTSWQAVSRIKWRHYIIIGRGIMTLCLCTKTVTISSRGPPNLSNFLFERQLCCNKNVNIHIKIVIHSVILHIGWRSTQSREVGSLQPQQGSQPARELQFFRRQFRGRRQQSTRSWCKKCGVQTRRGGRGDAFVGGRRRSYE